MVSLVFGIQLYILIFNNYQIYASVSSHVTALWFLYETLVMLNPVSFLFFDQTVAFVEFLASED